MKNKALTVLVAVGMISCIANAVDVTKFKIDGVGLGDSYEEIEKKLPCSDKDSDGIGGFVVACYDKVEKIRIRFDYTGKIYTINKLIKYNSNTDWVLIQKDVIAKYRKPDVSGTMMPPDKSYFLTSMVWGEGCNIRDASRVNDGWSGEYPMCNDKTNSFRVDIDDDDNKVNFSLISREREYAHLNTNRAKSEIQKFNNTSSSRSYNSWSTVSKNTIRDSSNSSQNFESTDIKCADGTKGYVNNFYNLITTYRYFANGKNSYKSFDEAANYICGNK